MTSTNTNDWQDYATLSLNGFYMIAVKFDDTVADATVIPKTYGYTCPYPSDYPDIHVNFPGCTANTGVPAPAFLPFTTTTYTNQYTTDISVSSTSLPFEAPIYNLGSLSSGDRLLLDIQVPDAGTNAALIREFSIQLIRGTRSGSTTDLAPQCSGVTYNCDIEQTISSTDDYWLRISDPTGFFV